MIYVNGERERRRKRERGREKEIFALVVTEMRQREVKGLGCIRAGITPGDLGVPVGAGAKG